MSLQRRGDWGEGEDLTRTGCSLNIVAIQFKLFSKAQIYTVLFSPLAYLKPAIKTLCEQSISNNRGIAR